MLNLEASARPHVRFVFFDRVATSDNYRYLTTVYELIGAKQDSVEPFWRENIPNYQLELRKVQTLDPPVPFGQAAPLWALLQTTSGKKIQSFFANSRVLLKIPPEDFEAIVSYTPSEDLSAPAVVLDEDVGLISLQSPTERLLEDYLVDHLSEIEAGLEAHDQDRVRQYPTGDGGRIDIFCKDLAGNPVVVELKRAGAREEVIGQLCRYMGWVMETQPEAVVRGIVVANIIDSRLKYAARAVPNVKLVQYHVNFSFNTVGE